MRKPVVALVALLVLALGAVAGASIPDADGVIHACRRRSDGRLRVIDTDKGRTCGVGERALNWNQTGPRGPQGTQGPEGPEGPQGVQGESGQDGALVAQRIQPSSSPYVMNNQGNAPGNWFGVPLTPSGYDQPASTLSILYGEATVTKPSPCDMASFGVEIMADGQTFASLDLQPADGQSETEAFQTVQFESSGHHYDYTARVRGYTGASLVLQVDVVEIA
jgi:hypothetical protein